MLRRSFLKGLTALFVAAPAIIRAESLMPIKEYMPLVPQWCPEGWIPCDGREIKAKYYPDLFAAYKRMRLPLVVSNDQKFAHYDSYETIENTMRNVKNVISYKDMKRPNGQIMRAGVLMPVVITQEMQNGR